MALPAPNFQQFATSHAEQDVESPTAAKERKQAVREAAGRKRRAQRNAIKFKFTVVGDPSLTAKTVIEIRGIGKRLSGNYYIENIKHNVGAGYTMVVTCHRDGSNRGRRRRATQPERTRGPVNNTKAPPQATPGAAAPALKPVLVVDVDQPSAQATAWLRSVQAEHGDDHRIIVVETSDVELVEN